MKGRYRFLIGTILCLALPGAAVAQELLYGGNGGQGAPRSINEGALIIVDQATAAVTVVGLDTGAARLTGIAFDSDGTLFASTLPAGGFPPPPPPMSSTLITLDPATGHQVASIGPILDGPGGSAISISDISFQPGTGALFGIRGEVDGGRGEGFLYRIDKATGVATLVGDTGSHFGTIAFAPDGTLYMAAAIFFQGPSSPTIKTLNPVSGAVLTSVPTSAFFGALAVRSDGTLFGGTGAEHTIHVIDPATGAATLVGDTGQNFVGSLAFHNLSSGPCVPDEFTLCLNNDRFSLFTRWRTNDGRTGQGHGVELTNDSGYFWIFNSANIEVVTKVLNACALASPRFWVFAAGLTNVEVTLFVTDMHTGEVKSYLNPLGTPFQPVQDTNAFDTCP